MSNNRRTELVGVAHWPKDAATLHAVAALEIAAELPTAQRCQAFIRAFIAEEKWAVEDVRRHLAVVWNKE